MKLSGSIGWASALAVAIAAASLTSCSFQSTRVPDPLTDASTMEPGSDAPAGGGSDAAMLPPVDAQICLGIGIVKVCLFTQPKATVTLPTGLLDTSSNNNCDQIVPQQGGPALCVITGGVITVTGSLVAVGTRPLVLVATDAILVNAATKIDVSSNSGANARRGAAANPADCSTPGKGRNDAGGAGGGAGGSFGTVGGRGGTGDLNNNDLPNTTAFGGGPGIAQPTPTVLRGGCNGGPGGEGKDSDQSNVGGFGGDGGGAVYLIAGNRIAITGDVFASGAGGRTTPGGGGREEGAGGGGSGGMIVLDAPTIEVQGRVAANGGAGGGGGGDSGGGFGSNGSTLLWDQRAPGGLGDPVQPPAGPAGNGAAGTATGVTSNLDGDSSELGAGGGAGGLGVIWTYGTLNGGAKVSPPPIQH